MKHHSSTITAVNLCAGLLLVAAAIGIAGCSSEKASPPPATTAAPASTPATTPPATAAPAAAPQEAAPAGTPPASTQPTTAQSEQPKPSAPPPPPPPRTYTLPAGHALSVYTSSTLSTKNNESGQRFTGTLAEPITDGNWVIAKKGAQVQGFIVDADEGHRVKGVASMTVTIKALTLADGRVLDLSASNYTTQAKTTKGKDAKKIGIATGIGTAIGAIAGGGKGAAIGAGVGAGSGTGVVLATRGDPAVIPAETRLRFTLKSPIKITEEPR